MQRGIQAVALSVVLAGCTDGSGWGFSEESGKIGLTAYVDGSVTSSRSSRAEFSDITPAHLTLRLTPEADGAAPQEWALSDFPNDKLFAEGTYTMEAFYGSEGQEGFETPYFHGSTKLKVEENQTTPVIVTAALKNAVIYVEYSDNFKAYMSSYSATVSTSKNEIAVSAEETRPVYVNPGQVALLVEFTKPNGLGAKIQATTFEAKAKTAYTFTVDIQNGSGEASLSIKLDELLGEEDVEIDLSDEILSAPAPEVSLTGFTSGEKIEFLPGMTDGISALKTNIIARAGLKAIELTTESSSLISQGWPASVNLLTASASEVATMKSLGLNALGVFNNPDKMAVLDFAGLINHLNYDAAANNVTSIKMTVSDNYGKVSTPVELLLEALPVQFQVKNVSSYINAEPITLDFFYNAGDPSSDLVIEYFKPTTAVWTKVKDVTVVPLSRLGEDYRATFTIPATSLDLTKDFKLRASLGNITSDEMTITRNPMLTAQGTPNAFTSIVYIPVTIGEKDNDATLFGQLMDGAEFYLSTDGGNNYSQATATKMTTDKLVKLEGLAANTNYSLKVKNDGLDLSIAPVYTFTTEAATPLPAINYAGTATDSGSYWKRWAFGDAWGTNNTMTTTDGAAYAYVRIAGTEPNDNALHLRTCGWGSGNTATGGNGTSGTCKYTDAGLFHLGSERTARPDGYKSGDNKVNNCSTGPVTTDDLVCGIDFPSRPASLSFNYRYSPKNAADKGYAEIWVKDATGNIISRQTITLDAASGYTTKTLSLSYDSHSPKGAKLYVKFLSSYDMEYIKRTNDNFSGPGFGNLSNGTFMGSQLWVKDIKLNY